MSSISIPVKRFFISGKGGDLTKQINLFPLIILICLINDRKGGIK
jgi:hypothetical protein